MFSVKDPSMKCKMFLDTIQSQLDIHVPTKEIRLHCRDKPWINAEVKDKDSKLLVANQKVCGIT